MADQIRVIVGELTEFTEKAIARVGVNITANLIETTPVDTGWARANWVPAIGTPFIVPSPNEGSGAGTASRRSRQEQGTASLTGYKLGRGPVFITNNVPYITELNEGSSFQAPAAFVQAAIAQGVKDSGGS